ncbi:MAG: UDP-N-acetylmuramoyl-L-alanyl-D-glutamate--2,6-diaminopimelate ligase [Bryobacterales bacterium]|nr:UDP-N-acetylmuramoyl-L-alanyl-D-glutamate--2,6-diaminopimelate ligase [Bryobacterales bacterium]
MRLAELFRELPDDVEMAPAISSLDVRGLAYDSRAVKPGALFFAFAGARTDGNRYAEDAIERGAVAVVSESPAPAGIAVPWIRVPHGRRALATAARAFYREAAERAILTGITGTNGKTTTAWLIDAVLRATGERTALIGTVNYRIGDTLLPAANTTPESLDIYGLIQRLSDLGGRYLTMEVSSHALALGRVHGVHYQTAVFTNLTQDHLDFHRTMDAYFGAKGLLFSPERAQPPTWAVLNADDPYANHVPLAPQTEAIRFGLNQTADLRALNVETGFQGISFDVEWQGKRLPLCSPMLGEFNVHNLLGAYGVCLSYGVDRQSIHEALAHTAAVPGRFERVDAGQPFAVVVDYAHTPDALLNLLQSARKMKPARVITVFGCGGDRDRSKRPHMAEAAASLSDFVVLTSDNPRSEAPLDIMNDALVGLQRFNTPRLLEVDRAEAIRRAIRMADAGDIVLIAGKGHETHQIFADHTTHFDDREAALAALRDRGFSTPPGEGS